MSATKPPLHRIREPYATISERFNERDREYFRDHPNEAAYLRRYVPGEYGPDSLAAMGLTPPGQDDWVLVHNVAPGIRSRRPIGRLVSGGPGNGRMTLLSSHGVICEDVPVVGWTGVAP